MLLPDADTSPGLGRHLVKKFILGAVIVVVLTATAVASALLLEVDASIKEVQDSSIAIEDVENVLDKVPLGAPQTILLLGSDRRFADIKAKLKPRSDTIIVAHLDPDQNATAIMSLPRDLRVPIPGHGTRKINEAYELGGPNLTIRTVRKLLGIPIHHVVSMHFGGFRRAIDRLGCVYADVDRRYFNDNSGPGENYATIDLKPGYQKLCGQDALDYVRYRHEDSDFVRAARQQEFLTQAKAQIGVGKIFGDRRELLRIFGRYTESDIAQRNTPVIINLLKLAYESSKKPIVEIRFPATDSADRTSVEISEEALLETVQRFIAVQGPDPVQEGAAKQRPKRIRARRGLAPGLVAAEREGEDHVLAMDVRLQPLGLPVFFPKVRLARGGYAQTSSPRSYEIYDRAKKRHRAYRIVLYAGEIGQYYGVQGTTWKTPPILADPTDERRIGDRTYRRYFDGRKIRLMAWETPQAVYWVTNSLTLKLTNRQMIEIARSVKTISP